jgi:hypothetical protein
VKRVAQEYVVDDDLDHGNLDHNCYRLYLLQMIIHLDYKAFNQL